MSDTVDVSVVVAARDAAATIERALDALARQEFAGELETIVVDDGSRDDTAAVAEHAAACDRVLRRVRADGAGAARNDGVAVARGRALAFTDADCEPVPGWVAAGVRALEQAELVQGAVLPAEGVPMGPFDRSLAVTSDRGLYQTASLFLHRDTFERLGGFEDWLGVEDDRRDAGGRPFGEDVWLGWRARRAGARVSFSPDALVRHAVFPGNAGSAIRERRRERHFPLLAARVPELRESFFYRRYFLSARSAAFDLAVAGAALALARRRPLMLAAAVPYAGQLLGEARRWGRRRAPGIAAVRLAADAVGAASLARGSLEARTPLL